MTKDAKPGDLAEAALALDRELRRFEELAAQAAQVKLNSEKALARATDALTRAAESQDRVSAQVQRLVAAIAEARRQQEADAAALVGRAHQIAARRAEFAQVLERMAALGQMTKEVQALLQAGPGERAAAEARLEEMARVADGIAGEAQAKEMEDLAREAATLRQQVLAAKNRLSLLRR